MQKHVDLSDLAAKWPSTIVTRKQVGEFSGGLLHPRTLANLDSLGQGPRNRFYAQGRVNYHVKDLIEWLEERAKRLDAEGN